MAGNSQRQGAVRKTSKKGATIGSGGKRRKALAGKGATPKAEDRVYHKAYKNKHSQLSKTKSSSTAHSRTRMANKKNSSELVLGRNPVLECLLAQVTAQALYLAVGVDIDQRLEEIIKICSNQDIPILEISRSELDRKTASMIHQGVALQVPPYKYAEVVELLPQDIFTENPLLVVLDNMSDPRNLGAIIRSAAAFGVTGVIIPQNRSVGVTAVAWRTSAGALAKVPVAKVTNLTQTIKQLASKGFQVVGLDPRAKKTCYEYEANIPLVVVVGSEGKGISRLVADNCDEFLSIPMPGEFESLNAAVASGIVLAEFARQRIG